MHLIPTLSSSTAPTLRSTDIAANPADRTTNSSGHEAWTGGRMRAVRENTLRLMFTLCCCSVIPTCRAVETVDEIQQEPELAKLLNKSDVVCCCVPGNAEGVVLRGSEGGGETYWVTRRLAVDTWIKGTAETNLRVFLLRAPDSKSIERLIANMSPCATNSVLGGRFLVFLRHSSADNRVLQLSGTHSNIPLAAKPVGNLVITSDPVRRIVAELAQARQESVLMPAAAVYAEIDGLLEDLKTAHDPRGLQTRNVPVIPSFSAKVDVSQFDPQYVALTNGQLAVCFADWTGGFMYMARSCEVSRAVALSTRRKINIWENGARPEGADAYRQFGKIPLTVLEGEPQFVTYWLSNGDLLAGFSTTVIFFSVGQVGTFQLNGATKKALEKQERRYVVPLRLPEYRECEFEEFKKTSLSALTNSANEAGYVLRRSQN